MRLRTRATAPNVLVRGRRWAHSRSFSNEWRFLLERIRFGVGPAVDDDLGGVDFGRLLFAAGGFHFAANGDAAAGRELLDFRFVVGEFRVGDDLDIGEAGAVVDFQKAEAAFGIAAGADPALQRDLLGRLRLDARASLRSSIHR